MFVIEITVLSISIDGTRLRAAPGLVAHLFGLGAEPLVHSFVTFAGLAITFAYLRKKHALNAFQEACTRAPISRQALTLHVALFGVLLAIARWFEIRTEAQGTVFVLAFLAIGAALLVSGLAIVLPLAGWSRLARSLGAVWIWAGIPALAVPPVTAGLQALWKPATALTYWLVQVILEPFLGTLVVDPARELVGTSRFSVVIAPGCSGLEGMGLLLLFAIVWFLLYRKEYRFPQALLLLPLGLVLLFVLNAARIAALLMIGHAGAQQIATEGFHSQAGWIAFNGVALGLCFVADRIPWIAAEGSVSVARSRENRVNLTAVYLVPFLALIAAGMLSRAMTGNFEWAYPLHVVAVLGVLAMYWPQYRNWNREFTWRGPALGVLVFVLWLGLEWALFGSPAGPAPAALQDAADSVRRSWVALRILGAVVVVPFAEELAFRGYLMRRAVAGDFDDVAPSLVALWPVALSSVAFGVMHGPRWVAGTVAGLIYAYAYVRNGRLADAIVAHAVTNGAIAVAVVGFGYWKLW